MDVRDRVPRVDVPTMVIHRRDDAFVPFVHGEYLASNIRGAELVELPGADGPMFWESPDLILESLERFVTGSTSKPVDKTELLTDVMAGSSFRFTDRGSHQLKGLSEPWQVFSVDTKPSTSG